MEDWTARTEMLIGADGVRRLAASSAAVFGIGGVGSYTAEALARAGVGRLLLVDGDTVTDTNRNRQLAALVSTVGRQKAAVMAARIADINPDCAVGIHTEFYGVDGAGRGWIDGYDVVADAVDMVSAKLLLAEECAAAAIPLVSAMGCGNKLDPTRLRVADIGQTSVCPLCRVMRRELRRRGIPALRVVYSDEPVVSSGDRTPGSISFVPGAAGLILAGEVIRILLSGDNPNNLAK